MASASLSGWKQLDCCRTSPRSGQTIPHATRCVFHRLRQDFSLGRKCEEPQGLAATSRYFKTRMCPVWCSAGMLMPTDHFRLALNDLNLRLRRTLRSGARQAEYRGCGAWCWATAPSISCLLAMRPRAPAASRSCDRWTLRLHQVRIFAFE